MSIDSKPSCPVVQRFAEDLKLNGKSARTQQSYCRALRKFSEYLGHPADRATEDQLRDYLLHVVEKKGWASSTVNVTLQALKIFFRITCPRDWSSLKLARVQVEQKLPVVISIGEVHKLLKLIEKPSMRCYFSVVYALGLRLNEGLHLQVSDVDSKRMLVHVHRGKGAKDRLVPLPQSTLDELRKYLKKYQDRMSRDQVKTLKALSRCRSAAAGSVVFRCSACSKLYQVPKSCGNRHCPTCQGSRAKAWLAQQQARLLPCNYFMMTFTVPKSSEPSCARILVSATGPSATIGSAKCKC